MLGCLKTELIPTEKNKREYKVPAFEIKRFDNEMFIDEIVSNNVIIFFRPFSRLLLLTWLSGLLY